jgi:hypothetical protein
MERARAPFAIKMRMVRSLQCPFSERQEDSAQGAIPCHVQAGETLANWEPRNRPLHAVAASMHPETHSATSGGKMSAACVGTT